MLCEVLKPITVADGRVLEVGSVVDASTWRYAKQLIEQKKIRPVEISADSNPIVEAKVAVAKKGRPRKTEG